MNPPHIVSFPKFSIVPFDVVEHYVISFYLNKLENDNFSQKPLWTSLTPSMKQQPKRH
jgi:hypothetical protein